MKKTNTNNHVVDRVPLSMNYKQGYKLTKEEITTGLSSLSKKLRRKEIDSRIVELSIEYLQVMGYQEHIDSYIESLDSLEEELESARAIDRVIKGEYIEDNGSVGGTEEDLVDLVTNGEQFRFASLRTA